MIVGAVNARVEAIVRLSILASDGNEQLFDAVLDTGFNGSLTLPAEDIAALSLPWRSRGLVTLANGMEDQCDIYAATIVWDGKEHHVLVEAADTDPLIGMALLRGYDVRMQIVEGGRVTIEALA